MSNVTLSLHFDFVFFSFPFCFVFFFFSAALPLFSSLIANLTRTTPVILCSYLTVLKGIAACGMWLCLRDFESLDLSTLSIISNYIFAIKANTYHYHRGDGGLYLSSSPSNSSTGLPPNHISHHDSEHTNINNHSTSSLSSHSFQTDENPSTLSLERDERRVSGDERRGAGISEERKDRRRERRLDMGDGGASVPLRGHPTVIAVTSLELDIHHRKSSRHLPLSSFSSSGYQSRGMTFPLRNAMSSLASSR